jgi:hypothetical protein
VAGCVDGSAPALGELDADVVGEGWVDGLGRREDSGGLVVCWWRWRWRWLWCGCWCES